MAASNAIMASTSSSAPCRPSQPPQRRTARVSKRVNVLLSLCDTFAGSRLFGREDESCIWHFGARDSAGVCFLRALPPNQSSTWARRGGGMR
jgi:hypothetical protein